VGLLLLRSGRVATCSVVNENMDGRLLKRDWSRRRIAASWTEEGGGCFTQDNDPKRKSREVQSWLHNHGIRMLDIRIFLASPGDNSPSRPV